ncbi:MAG: hypothetical protein AAB695_00660 [Patescibacteria group bacterium]
MDIRLYLAVMMLAGGLIFSAQRAYKWMRRWIRRRRNYREVKKLNARYMLEAERKAAARAKPAEEPGRFSEDDFRLDLEAKAPETREQEDFHLDLDDTSQKPEPGNAEDQGKSKFSYRELKEGVKSRLLGWETFLLKSWEGVVESDRERNRQEWLLLVRFWRKTASLRHPRQTVRRLWPNMELKNRLATFFARGKVQAETRFQAAKQNLKDRWSALEAWARGVRLPEWRSNLNLKEWLRFASILVVLGFASFTLGFLPSISLNQTHGWWLVVLVSAIIVAASIGLYKKFASTTLPQPAPGPAAQPQQAAAPATEAWGMKWLRPVATAALVIFVVFLAGYGAYTRFYSPPATASAPAQLLMASTPNVVSAGEVKLIKVGKEESETFYFQANKIVDIRAMRAEAEYAIRTQSGEYECRPGVDCQIPGVIMQASVRALGNLPEEIRIAVR